MPEQNPPQDKPSKSIYMPYGASGGGGAGGRYVFTDLAHLDRVIAKWIKIRDDLREDARDLREAIGWIAAPAEDRYSVAQAKAAKASLTKGLHHNQSMIDYANDYINKLQATRKQYASTEENNVDTLRNADQQR